MQSPSTSVELTVHTPSFAAPPQMRAEPLASPAATACGPMANDYPRDATLSALFEAQVARRPEATALIEGGERLTYGELNRRANHLAHYLQARGVNQGAFVGIYLPRGIGAVTAILAILKLGATYLPLDTADPSKRVIEILNDAKAVAVISLARLLRRIEGGAPLLIALDHIANELADCNPVDLPGPLGPLSLCYVMFTSGSTGRPKGVMVNHRAVIRLVRGTDYINFGETKVFLQLAPICFDASTFELWGALLHGAQLVIAPDGTPDPDEIASLLQQHRVCTMWLTAGLFNAFVDICPRLFSGLDQLIVGGEPLSPGHVRRVDQLLPPGARIVNGYGPTEGTTFTCCYNIPRPVSAELRSIPIGRPIAHTNVYVVDDHLRPVSLGSSGELCIGGDGLAVGYLNAPQLTAEKFVSNLYSPTEGERIYRTGDLARWGDDGNLEFLGRTDQQIKVRGHRVEPAEIEWALQEHKDIVRCLVGLREQHAGEKVLVAYFVAKGSPVPAATDLRSHLRTLLPEYMLPTAFIQVPHLPLNANGKLDRNCLASLPWHEQRNESNRLEFCSAEERVMAEMWADILGTTCVGRNDHFVFDLAGNSLLALQLIDRVNRRFGARLKVPDILSTPTVATMCAKVVACAKPSNEVVRYLDVVRPGARPVAVVCVGFANALPLLRETLADGVPIWWLKLDGLHAPPYSIRPIPEIAASYASELSQVAASELVLVGHSYCGLIVLELARHLRTSGRRVKALLLEPPLPQAFQRQVAARDECRRNRWHYSWKPVVDRRQTMTHRAKAVQHCDRFKLPTSQDFRAAMQWTAMRLQRRYRKSLLRPLLQVYVRLGCDLPLRYRQWWYYYPELKRRIRSFTINRASGPVVLAGQPSYLDNYLASWQCLLDGQVETCCLPAATRHTDLMKQPAAAEWLALVSRWAGS